MAKVFCPNCASIANPLHRASMIGTATGITAGGTVVVVGMVRGARMGSALGVVGTTVGAVAGGILNLLWGVTSGGLRRKCDRIVPLSQVSSAVQSINQTGALAMSVPVDVFFF